jgi:hypothetical protein
MDRKEMSKETRSVKPAILIGNGPSRLPYRIKRLKSLAPVFGCNAAYRDFPWLAGLGIIDPEITKEVEASSFEGKIIYRYRHNENMRGFFCGPMMLSYLADNWYNPIFMLGMDFTIKTIYAGTNGYCPPQPIDATQPTWYDEMVTVLKEHDLTTYFVECGHNITNHSECWRTPKITWKHMIHLLRELA